jgi:hypothetical protein
LLWSDKTVEQVVALPNLGRTSSQAARLSGTGSALAVPSKLAVPQI